MQMQMQSSLSLLDKSEFPQSCLVCKEGCCIVGVDAGDQERPCDDCCESQALHSLLRSVKVSKLLIMPQFILH